MMTGMCCRASYEEWDIASQAKPNATMGKKRVMELDLMPNSLGLSVVFKTGLMVCFSAAVEHLDSAGDRDRELQEVHVVRGGRGGGSQQAEPPPSVREGLSPRGEHRHW